MGPALLKGLPEHFDTGLYVNIILADLDQHTNSAHPPRLLRACGKRPRHRRAAEQRDELAPLHSITSSARASRVAGTSRPMVFAVCRLMTNSATPFAVTPRDMILYREEFSGAVKRSRLKYKESSGPMASMGR